MIWLYDGSWEGLLSAVFQVFQKKDGEAVLHAEDGFTGLSLYPVRRADTSETQAGRVTRGMERLSPELPEVAYRAFLSEQPDREQALLGTLRAGFARNKNPLPLRQLEPVRRLNMLAERVGSETRLFLGIVRFISAGDGLYVADIEPDGCILPLLGEHFHMRFNTHRLMIRDVKRRIALLSTPEEWVIAALPDGPLPSLPKDGFIEDAWRAYFAAIANPARKNLKCQQKFVPLKYRKHITEFQPGTGDS